MIYSNQDGQIAFESSSSIADPGKAIFTPDIQERFAELVSPRSSTLASLPGAVTSGPIRSERGRGGYSHIPGRPRQKGSWSPMSASPAPLIPCDWQFDQSRRHRRNGRRRDLRMAGSMTPDFDYNAMSLPSSSACVIRVDDEARLKKYYEKAFDSFQQLNCRVIAKAFIKLVEPRKQVNYPYNGRRASSSPGGERRADPEMTKPPWWPVGVTHKEPDHLLKPGTICKQLRYDGQVADKDPERIQLLIHILRELGESHDVTAEKLRDAGQDVRRSISPPERLQILDEVYSVRHMEERYLRGEICEYSAKLLRNALETDCFAAGDVLIPISQVSLVGPEFETSDGSSTPDSQIRKSEVGDGGGSPWGMDSLTMERVRGQEPASDGRSDGTTTAVTYDHLMPERSQSFSLPYSNAPSLPGAPSSTRASSFDSNIQYSPRDYNSSTASSVISPETSPHSIDLSPQNHRPSFSTYLNQTLLPSVPVTTSVLWNPTLHASAPSYQSPY
uniref:Subtelomeric hrmA-associated cluster protein AFUB-079030/YDR124W-like helical bundle domain-containing protein n=1 Tax=Talaromyces marneffei PM1 TaxID=1077442 RepID=A0A093VTJ0_TALMA